MDLTSSLERRADELLRLNRFIWEHPEISGQEAESAEYQIRMLERAGFTVSRFRKLPTAFVARAGSGRVRIGLAGEYDALPGLSQKCVGRKESAGQDAGHGCGHNLICTGCMTAALLLKDLADSGELDATVCYYGCAAEETLAGKCVMIGEGAFRDLDFCLTWHPFDVNKVYDCSTLSVCTIDFEFRGVASHAAVSPEQGRSALDAVELMNVGANYLREHVVDKARIHYIVTNGGLRANIVPETASSEYMVRAPKAAQMLEIVDRIVKIAKGAALMTETEMSYRVVSGNYEYAPNRTIGNVLRKHYGKETLPELSAEDRAVYEGVAATLTDAQRISNCGKFGVRGFDPRGRTIMDCFDPTDWSSDILPGSSDLGDVSLLVPTGKLMGAGWALGTANHTWQAAACSGTGYAGRLALVMGKVLAESAREIASDPQLLGRVREEFEAANKGFRYRPLEGYRADVPD